MLNLIRLYNYIFSLPTGNIQEQARSDIAKSTDKVKPIAGSSHLPQKSKTKETSQEIKQFFQEEFLEALSNPMFRAALQTRNRPDLQRLLFETPAGSAPLLPYSFPTDATINEKLDELVQRHGFFKRAQNSKYWISTQETFKKLFTVCKLVADFTEKNNNNNDELAFEHAYKLMVLFYDPTAKNKQQDAVETILHAFERFLSQHNLAQAGAPVHDSLVNLTLPQGGDQLKDLAKWRGIIVQKSIEAMKLFGRALEIEQALGYTPDSYQAALETAIQLQYKRAKENPELAELCNQYHLSEMLFEKCLTVWAKRKQTDRLPTITLDGALVQKADGKTCQGYYMVKLPVDDPRALLLGKITNCCQSIGGDAERCVIDGVTREHNGFYVLLKAHRKQTSSPFTKGGKIDYRCYEIVGQGYAWLSNTGNLAFDSWENLRPSVENAVIVPMLQQFSRRVTKKCPSITRVIIGQGGKTPAYLKEGKSVDFPEFIKEGYQYPDSQLQSLIYCDAERTIQLRHETEALLPKAFSQELVSLLIGSINSEKEEAGWLRQLLSRLSWLTDAENQPLLYQVTQQGGAYAWKALAELNEIEAFDPECLSKLLEMFAKIPADLVRRMYGQLATLAARPQCWPYLKREILLNNPEIIDELRKLDQANLLTPAIGQALVNNVLDTARLIDSTTFAEILIKVDNFNLLTSENLQALLKHANYMYLLADALIKLHQVNLLTPKNHQVLLDHVEHTGGLANGLVTLQQANLLTPENHQTLIDHIEHADSLAGAWVKLHQANLLTPENRQVLLNHAKHADSLAGAWVTLHQSNLLMPESRQVLVDHVECANSLAKAWVKLHQANLLTSENRQVLINHAKYADSLASAWVKLHKANLLTPENRQVLVDYAKRTYESVKEYYVDCAFELAKGLITLHQAKLLTPESRQMLLDHAEHANSLAGAWVTLHQASQLAPEYRQVILDSFNSEYLGSLLKALVTLHQAGLLTSENWQIIRRYPGFVATGLAEMCVILEQAGLWTAARQQALLTGSTEEYITVIRVINSLQRLNLLTEESCQIAFGSLPYLPLLLDWLYRLRAPKVFGHEKVKNAYHSFKDIELVAYVVYWLKDLNLLSEKNCQAIFDNLEGINSISNVFSWLKDFNLLNRGNCQKLFNNLKHVGVVADLLNWLNQANLLNGDNCQRLFDHFKGLNIIETVFYWLNHFKLLTPENAQTFLTNFEQLAPIASACYQLNYFGLLDAENCQMLFSNPSMAKTLAKLLWVFKQSQESHDSLTAFTVELDALNLEPSLEGQQKLVILDLLLQATEAQPESSPQPQVSTLFHNPAKEQRVAVKKAIQAARVNVESSLQSTQEEPSLAKVI